MRSSTPKFSELLNLLVNNNIEFVIIGGFAGVLYGSSLVTSDLDLCLFLDEKTVSKLRVILAPYSPKHRVTPQKLSFIDFPEDIARLKNLYIETSLGVIDLLTDVIGVGDFNRVRSKSTSVRLFGTRCEVISLEDLIKTKKAMGREKDLFAVKELEIILAKK